MHHPHPLWLLLNQALHALKLEAEQPLISEFERLQLASVHIYLEAAQSNLQAIERYSHIFGEEVA